MGACTCEDDEERGICGKDALVNTTEIRKSKWVYSSLHECFVF